MKQVCLELGLNVVTGKYRPTRLLNTDIEVVNVDVHDDTCRRVAPNLLAAATRRDRFRASQGHSLSEESRITVLESTVCAGKGHTGN